MSQPPGINGIGGMHVYDGKPQRAYFKDSDSQYVRLAKEGGVKDLLKHEESGDKPGAVPYNRVNWFYLEDNAAEDARKRKNMKWTFGAPEYLTNSPSTQSDSSEPNEERTERSESPKPKECIIDPVNIEPAGINRKYETFDHPFIHSYETPTEHKEKEEDEKIGDYLTEQINTENLMMPEPLVVTKQIKKGAAHPQQWKNPITQDESSGDSFLKGSE